MLAEQGLLNVIESIASTLIPGIVVAVVTAFITVRLSLKRFYSERWWERKAAAYTKIMEAMYNYRRYVEERLDQIQTGRDVAKAKQSQREDKAQEARHQIEKAAAMGAFVLSEEAVASVTQLIQALRKAESEETFYEYLDAQHHAVCEAMSGFREHAKRDLRV